MEILYPELKRKIYISLGIFCSRCPTFKATNLLLKKINIKPEEILKINYREKYNMVIILKNGSRVKVDYQKYWHTDFKYKIPIRCLMCPDRLNDFSDLSFGDDWETNSSVIMVRNKKALRIIQNINGLQLTKFDHTKIKMLINQAIFKKLNLQARLFVLKKLGYHIPILNCTLPKANIFQYIKAIYLVFRVKILSNLYK
jgi:coenzyme F420-reducing hydrogenase beta subunit